MSEIRRLLKKITDNNNNIYSKSCIVRELTANNTCTVEPMDDVTYKLDTPNEDNYIYDVKYSPDPSKSVTPPKPGYPVFVIFFNNEDAFVASLSVTDSLTVGAEGEIVFTTKDTKISGTSSDDSNVKSILLLLADRFRIDLAGNRGFYDYTGEHLWITDAGEFIFQNKCGNSIKINCDGISNIISNDSKFFLGKSGTMTEDIVSNDCNVLNPIKKDGSFDILNALFKALSIILGSYDGLTKTNFKVIKDELELPSLKSLLPPQFYSVLGDYYNNINITTSVIDVYKDFVIPEYRILTNEILKYYIVDNDNINKYWHSDYQEFANKIVNNLRKLDDFILGIRLGTRTQIPVNDYKMFFGNKVTVDAIATILDAIIKPGADTNSVFLQSTSLLLYDNGLNYGEEKGKCAGNITTSVEKDATVTLKTILDDLKTIVDGLKSATSTVLDLGVAVTGSSGVMVGLASFNTSMSSLNTKLNNLESNIDFLLK